MKYAAVIFDLFGTLVDSFSLQEHEGTLRRMASVLSAPPDDFVRLWFDTFNQRMKGIIPSPADNVEHICRTLGIRPPDTQIKLAAQIRSDMTTRGMTPRADAIEVLSYLKSEGYKTGLITNCSAEVPTIWKDTPFSPLFDVAVFSCSTGLMKPEPGIYQLAIEQLAVEPETCLYVGDGSNRELTGAAQIGMHPVLLRTPDNSDSYQIDAEVTAWDGPTISSLKDVLTLLE